MEWIPLTKENYDDIKKINIINTVYSCFDIKTGKTYTDSGYYFSGEDGNTFYNSAYMSNDYYEYNPELGYWVNNESGDYIVAYCVLTPFKFELEG
jgi:hypothetical protein